MKNLQVKKSMTVVVYDHMRGFFATRAAFMLKAFGHPKVYVLDGNFAKWQKEGRPVESDISDDCDYEAMFDYNLIDGSVITYE